MVFPVWPETPTTPVKDSRPANNETVEGRKVRYEGANFWQKNTAGLLMAKHAFS